MENKRNKGQSLLCFPDDFCVVDIETTGLSPVYDEIIELSALKVRNSSVIDEFSTLIKPDGHYFDNDDDEEIFLYVDDFITELTGITNKMLETAPSFSEVIDEFLSFIGDSVIIGHNVNFDINFIYDTLLAENGMEFKNDFCDLLRISRHLFPELQNHKLLTIASALNISVEDAHRGLADCLTTFECFQKCKAFAEKNNINLENKKKKSNLDLRKITTSKENFDHSHPLFGKVCVFTGSLEKMKRAEAAKIVVDFGGICENGVTARSNFLILGNNDYCKSIKDGKSSKQKKAEKLILNGQDLKIIPEDVFYEMLTK